MLAGETQRPRAAGAMSIHVVGFAGIAGDDQGVEEFRYNPVSRQSLNGPVNRRDPSLISSRAGLRYLCHLLKFFFIDCHKCVSFLVYQLTNAVYDKNEYMSRAKI
jgi:hypothetical protein